MFAIPQSADVLSF
jgi:hypothetical protein